MHKVQTKHKLLKTQNKNRFGFSVSVLSVFVCDLVPVFCAFFEKQLTIDDTHIDKR